MRMMLLGGSTRSRTGGAERQLPTLYALDRYMYLHSQTTSLYLNTYVFDVTCSIASLRGDGWDEVGPL